MPEITITLKGVDEAVFKFDSLDVKVAEGVREVVKDISDRVERAAKKLCPVDTGRLRASIWTNMRKDELGAEVGTNVDYAAHVEFGTKAHVIRPKNKKFLSFKINGKWIRARVVNHPGTRPQPFMFPAFEMYRQRYQDEMLQVLKYKIDKAVKQ
jgi:HK97 gp10 family phage protein